MFRTVDCYQGGGCLIKVFSHSPKRFGSKHYSLVFMLERFRSFFSREKERGGALFEATSSLLLTLKNVTLVRCLLSVCAINQNVESIIYASDTLNNDRDFVLSIISRSPSVLEFLNTQWQDEEEALGQEER